MRKIASLLCCAVVLLLLPLNARAYEDVYGEGRGMLCGDNLSWSIDGSVLYITGQGDMYDFPYGAPWIDHRFALTRVVISDGVTSVGASAFRDYDSLLSVDFGSGVTRIGTEAFYSCDGLTSVTLPRAFKKFGESSFRACTNLREIHCSGNFPRFDENCLWETNCTIYYSVDNPWSPVLVEQLENAFHGRIEFRASDGSDPYVPTQPVQETQPVIYIPETTAPVTEPPLDAPIVFIRPTEATVPVQTMPPVTEPPTQPPTYQEPTRETFLMATQSTRATEAAAPARGTDGNSIFGLLIVVLTLSIIATAALVFRAANRPKKRRRHKKRRK